MPIPRINLLRPNCRPPQLNLTNPGNPFSTLSDYIKFDGKNDSYRACLEADMLRSTMGQSGNVHNTLKGLFISSALKGLMKVFIEGTIERIKEFLKQIAKINELARGAS